MRAPPISRRVIVVVAAVAAGGLAVAVAVAAGGTGPATPTAPHFIDETSVAGIDHRYDGDFEFFVGGGVAAFDCDDDGLPDLYFAGGSQNAALYRNDSQPGGALHFAREPDAATDLAAVTGAYPLDVDSDGRTDLAVLRRGEDVILRGRGDCEFERANEPLGIDGGTSWTVAFSAMWEGSNELPTMAFGDYLEPDRAIVRGQPTAPACCSGRPLCAAGRADARLLHACRSCSAIGSGRVSATCG